MFIVQRLLMSNIYSCTMELAKLSIKNAIEGGNLATVKTIIAEHPQILRTPITEKGGTPLHLACNPSQLSGFKTVWAAKHAFARCSTKSKPGSNDNTRSQLSLNTGEEDMVELLIDQEKGMGAILKGTPSYNMKDENGNTPVFQDNTSTRMVESQLNLDDLEVTNATGKPLLWFCAKAGRISERIACDLRLRNQLGQRWEGSLPIEVLHLRVEEIHLQDALPACTTIVKALEDCPDEVKAVNLGALLLMCEERKYHVEMILNAAQKNYLSLKYFTNDREMRQAFWDDATSATGKIQNSPAIEELSCSWL